MNVVVDSQTFPPIDSEVGHILEVSFSQDSKFLNLGLQYGIVLPWKIAAYTDGNTIKVIAGVPQALLRSYFKDDKNIKQLLSLASQYQSKIEKVVASALQSLNFKTNINSIIKNTQLGESEITAIETAHGNKLTHDFATPSITITDNSIDAKTVINAITKAFLADQNGDHAILPNAVNNYLTGSMSFEDFFKLIEQGKDIWAKGDAFQNWNLLRTMEFYDEKGSTYQRIEVSQQFYASMGLGFGLHHMPALPCSIGVWKDSTGVHINLTNPRFLLDKVYAITRGSNWIDVYDVRLTKYLYNIPLQHGPRSAEAYNTALGLILVTGSDKAMASLIDPKTDTVVAVAGNDTKTNPKDYGGSLSSGHPFWLTERLFVIIDRANRKIQMYRLNGQMGNWQTELVNEVTTPTSVHYIIPRDNNTSNTYYAIAEGSVEQPPLLLELQLNNEKLLLNQQVAIKTMGITGKGSHHGDFHPDGKHIYIGTDEGHCFVVNRDNMKVVTVIETGKGHGHTTFVPKRNIAISINHKDTYISIIDTTKHSKITDITVSGKQQNNQKLQSHTYYLSPDNRYYYAFASDNGIFYELDLEKLKITQTIKTGGTPIQGVFIDRSEWMGH
ncbi:hypothetical protein [Candidatus Marithrix sp. Canyon 246]|uniref:hypothetical protein n=1 Tax=Candidatus Marithrix sp. Canyon 246 TaxID=1827136 RepID=UPI00084A24CE|nr:hypothetical protein [Candidatus Marithrix sp. Canyon 246]